jgi:Spy/CpxP family protein refolding chaperone
VIPKKLNSALVLMNTSSSPLSTAAVWMVAGAWQIATKEIYRMRKSLLCALLALTLACGASALYAQQDNMSQPDAAKGPGMKMSPDQRLQHMTKALNLTDDQQQKIKPILESQSQQMQTLRQDTTMSQQDKWSKMREIHQTTNDQIKPILTADQQQKWEQMQARHMGHGMNHGAPEGAAPPQAPPQ